MGDVGCSMLVAGCWLLVARNALACEAGGVTRCWISAKSRGQRSDVGSQRAVNIDNHLSLIVSWYGRNDQCCKYGE